VICALWKKGEPMNRGEKHQAVANPSDRLAPCNDRIWANKIAWISALRVEHRSEKRDHTGAQSDQRHASSIRADTGCGASDFVRQRPSGAGADGSNRDLLDYQIREGERR
jgi:hypothetical protein